jgi:fumarylacetoacetase
MMGEPIPIHEAEEYILGCVLVNDWSARDVQRWEYQPLGPFLAKSFATSISPWLVTLDALEPFRCAGIPQDPEPLPHLQQHGLGHYNIQLEVSIKTLAMDEPEVICRSNSKHLYWSFVQQLTHQTSNGTPIEVGDLYASGTISGESPDSFGSLLELTWRGQNPIQLSSGETRTFLEDGDELTMTGWCQGDGFCVGFGDVTAEILPSV